MWGGDLDGQRSSIRGGDAGQQVISPAEQRRGQQIAQRRAERENDEDSHPCGILLSGRMGHGGSSTLLWGGWGLGRRFGGSRLFGGGCRFRTTRRLDLG